MLCTRRRAHRSLSSRIISPTTVFPPQTLSLARSGNAVLEHLCLRNPAEETCAAEAEETLLKKPYRLHREGLGNADQRAIVSSPTTWDGKTNDVHVTSIHYPHYDVTTRTTLSMCDTPAAASDDEQFFRPSKQSERKSQEQTRQIVVRADVKRE